MSNKHDNSQTKDQISKDDSTSMTDRKFVINCTDMTEVMQQKVLEVTNAAINKFVRDQSKGQRKPEERAEMEREIERGALREIAQYIKKAFDDIQEGPAQGTWHCVFGRSFGSFVSHERAMIIHVTVDNAHVLLWKHG